MWDRENLYMWKFREHLLDNLTHFIFICVPFILARILENVARFIPVMLGFPDFLITSLNIIVHLSLIFGSVGGLVGRS